MNVWLVLAGVSILCPLLTAMKAYGNVSEEAAGESATPRENLRYYGYHLVGSFDKYRDDLVGLAAYTNLISFSPEGIAPSELTNSTKEEKRQRFARVARQIRDARAMGFHVLISNSAMLELVNGEREVWRSWLEELKGGIGDVMPQLLAFYIMDEPDLKPGMTKYFIS